MVHWFENSNVNEGFKCELVLDVSMARRCFTVFGSETVLKPVLYEIAIFNQHHITTIYGNMLKDIKSNRWNEKRWNTFACNFKFYTCRWYSGFSVLVWYSWWYLLILMLAMVIEMVYELHTVTQAHYLIKYVAEIIIMNDVFTWQLQPCANSYTMKLNWN